MFHSDMVNTNTDCAVFVFSKPMVPSLLAPEGRSAGAQARWVQPMGVLATAIAAAAGTLIACPGASSRVHT
ncbi:hypothetical protein RB195_013750 [Necator americanus]|uniref:Uncharacterized protein n=1 Tax=Necator americanus TaxID=51031 RepID=A0ABR1DX28_NECAM